MEEEIYHSSDKKDAFGSTGKVFASVNEKDGFHYIDRSDMKNNLCDSSGKKSIFVSAFDSSGIKKNNTAVLRKCLEGLATLEELEVALEENINEPGQIDTNLLIDLSSKLNMGKEIQSETAEICSELKKADTEGRMKTTSFLGDMLNQADILILKIKEHKLILKAEEQILKSLTSLRQLLRKILSSIESSKAKRLENNGSSNIANRIHEDNLSFGQELMQLIENDFDLGEYLESQQLNSMYVELLSLMEQIEQIPINDIFAGVNVILKRICTQLEDSLNCAIWLKKANEIVDSNSMLNLQLSHSKLQEIIKQAPKDNDSVKNKVSELTNMGNKYSSYVCSYQSISDDLEERRISQLSASELKALQENLTELSKKYKLVPYCLKIELKAKQQKIEKTIESIGWSAAAKGILEKRVNTLDELQAILQEQTQQSLQPSQNRLIQDINMRITAVKNANATLNRIKLSSKLPSGSKKLSVEVFTELSDTFKDLNQYINLDKNIEEVELFLQEHHQQEMQILKLYKNWTHRLNEQSLNLGSFRKDIQSLKDIMIQSIFEWTKYESNVRGLELVLKIKEALDDNNKGMLSLVSAQDLLNEIHKFEASDNFVLKSFEGKKEFVRQIKEAESIKSELNLCNKKPLSCERLDEIITSLQNSCINCSAEKSKVNKMNQVKEKILLELRIIENGANNLSNKVGMKKVVDLLEQMKTCCLIMEPGRSILERKLHLAGQLRRSALNYGNLDVEKLIQQYNYQTIQIPDIEQLITDNKLIEDNVIEYQDKLQYCWEDYEDLIELMQSLMGVKQCFQNKEKIVLLRHKVLVLITVCIYNNWKNRRQLTGLTYQTFKLLLQQLQELDDKFHSAKNTMEKMYLFNLEYFKQRQAERNMQAMQIEEEEVNQNESTEQKMIVEEDESKTQEVKEQEGNSQIEQQEEQESPNEQGEQKNDQQIEEEQLPQQKEEKKSIQKQTTLSKQKSFFDAETQFHQFMSAIQNEVVSETNVVRLCILKACRDEMEKWWDAVTARVKEIRNITRLADIDKAENEYIYRIGCVDLMDILIEHKISLQLKEEHTKRTNDLQDTIKQNQIKQYLAKTQNFPKPNEINSIKNSQSQLGTQQHLNNERGKGVGIISAGVASIMNKQQKNTGAGAQTAKTNSIQVNTAGAKQVSTGSTVNLDDRIENMMVKGGFSASDKKSKNIVKRMLVSLIQNPYYVDIDRGLLENTALFMAKRVAQTKTPSEIIEIMLVLVDHIKTDFYSSEQYRREAFSFNTLVTMTKLRFAALQKLAAQKKYDGKHIAEPSNMNEIQKKDKIVGNIVAVANKENTNSNNNNIIGQQAQTQEIQMSKEQNVNVNNNNNNGNQEEQRIDSKKIIDHLEYLSLTEGFSNTDNHDPHEKELRQLMQSKDTLQQFRKLQAELRRIGGEELPQDIEKKLSSKSKDKARDSASVSKKSVGRMSGKKSEGKSSVAPGNESEGEFSSEDEEEYEQDLIASHPSVLKYIKGVGKGQAAKTLIDPIKEEEMDGFVEFCLGLMRAKKNKENKTKHIMFNPNEGEDDDELNQNNIQCMLAGHYDPETAAEETKKKYVLFSGDCEMKAASLKVICVVIERESVIAECPILQTGCLKQSGECESREAKEFLLRTYRSQSVLTLFGEIENLEQQSILDSVAQDLNERDRVGTAIWSTSTKLYFFNKKLFERDHQNGRVFKKFSATSSELCFALVFKPAGLTPEQITAIPRIKQFQTLEDYYNQINIEQNNAQKAQQLQKNAGSKPQFKKPLPRYRKDTVLRTYVPIKEGIDGSQSEFSVLNILLKPDEQREREVKRKWKEPEGKMSIFKKPSSIKASVDQAKKDEVEAFFLRRLDGKRTVKPSLKKLDDIKLRIRQPNENELEIPFPREKSGDEDLSMKKRSVHFSDLAESDNPECEGINDYSLQLEAMDQDFDNNNNNNNDNNNNNNDPNNDKNYQDEDDKISVINPDQDINTSYEDLESHRKYGAVSPFDAATPSQDPRIAAKFNRPPALSSVSSISRQSVQSEYSHPLSSNISVSSVSPGSIDKNRQRLLEFASILENIKPSTFKTAFSGSKSTHNNNTSSVGKITDNRRSQMGIDDEIEYSRSVTISPPSSSPSIHPIQFNNPYRINANQDTQISKYSNENDSDDVNGDNNSVNIEFFNKDNKAMPFTPASKQQTYGKPSAFGSDGLTTPQLSISKDSIDSKLSYSKASVPSSDFSANMMSGKRSYNNTPQPYSFHNGEQPSKQLKPNNDKDNNVTPSVKQQQQPGGQTTFFQKFMQNQNRLQQTGIFQQKPSLGASASSSNQQNNNSNSSQTISKSSMGGNYSNTSNFSISSDHSNLTPSSEISEEQSNNKSTPRVQNFLNNHFQSESSDISSSNNNSNVFQMKSKQNVIPNRQMKPILGMRNVEKEDGRSQFNNNNYNNNNRAFQNMDTSEVDELVEDTSSPVGIPQQNNQLRKQQQQQNPQQQQQFQQKAYSQNQRAWELKKQPFKSTLKGNYNDSDSSSSLSSVSSQQYHRNNNYKSQQLNQNFIQGKNDELQSPSPLRNNQLQQKAIPYQQLQQQQQKKNPQGIGFLQNMAENIQQQQQQLQQQMQGKQEQRKLPVQSAKSSAFIYEQDSYQYNSKLFSKSIQKKQNSMVGSDLEFEENSSNIDPSSSSCSSKSTNENQLMDLRNQLDSLLSVIQMKKQSIHPNR